jgi:hypothetical protein|tara:strand:+ start:283 stop:444 length:162 start_codon:yes stop_codon:yes gene_type:complete
MTKKERKELSKLAEEIREAVSCCCSEFRYMEINSLVSRIEKLLKEKAIEPSKN